MFPWAFLSAIVLISSVLALFIPETSGSSLPDVPEEAEVIGFHRRQFYLNNLNGDLNFIISSLNPPSSSGSTFNSCSSGGRRVKDRTLQIPQDISQSFRYHKYPCALNSSCSQCSVEFSESILENVVRSGGSTGSKSFKRYPISKFRRSFNRKRSRDHVESIRTNLASQIKATACLSKTNANSPEVNKPKSNYSTMNKIFEFRPKLILPPAPKDPPPDPEEDYSGMSLCSLEMRHVVRPKSPTDLQRKERLQNKCLTCRQTLRLAKKVKNKDKHVVKSSQVEENQNPPCLVCSSNNNNNNSEPPQSEAAGSSKNSETPKISNDNSSKIQAGANPKVEKAVYQVPNKPNDSKPKIRVSSEILLRMQELKRSAKEAGQCDLFNEVSTSSSKVNE